MMKPFLSFSEPISGWLSTLSGSKKWTTSNKCPRGLLQASWKPQSWKVNLQISPEVLKRRVQRQRNLTCNAKDITNTLLNFHDERNELILEIRFRTCCSEYSSYSRVGHTAGMSDYKGTWVFLRDPNITFRLAWTFMMRRSGKLLENFKLVRGWVYEKNLNWYIQHDYDVTLAAQGGI